MSSGVKGKIEQILWQEKSKRPAAQIFTRPLLFQDQILFTPAQPYAGIISYDLRTDSYKLIAEYPEEFNSLTNPSICIDKDHKLLYIFERGYITNIFYIYDLVNDKWHNINDIVSDPNVFGENSTSTIINGTYHIIGGKHNEHHYSLNTECLLDSSKLKTAQKFTQMGSLPWWLNGAPLIKVNIGNTFKLLLIGGRTHSAMLGNVYVGTCRDDKYMKWEWNISEEMTLPNEMGYFGSVFVECMKTIIIFGGKIEENYFGCCTDDIYYLQLDKKPVKWIISTVKCAIKDNFYAICVDNMVEYILLNGFVRNVLNGALIPDSILQLIAMLAKQCEIHLLQRGNGCQHWTIDVNALLVPSVRNEMKAAHNTNKSSQLISELFGV